MKVKAIRATTVTVPLTSTIRHSNGAHWGRFVRTIVEVEADNGLVGLGEMGGGGESAVAAFHGLQNYLEGHDPFDLEGLRMKIANPTASLYNNRTQLLAALEFACLDLMGKYLKTPCYKLLGGMLRSSVPFASYIFFNYPNSSVEGSYEVRTADQVVDEAKRLKQRYGFTHHKLKGGVFSSQHELECYLALNRELPNDTFRWDPNAIWSPEESIDIASKIEHCRNDWLEDPTWGLCGMRRVREKTRIPLATNTVVVNFEQLASNIRDPSCDVILLDTTFWGGVRQCIKAAAVCDTFQLGIGLHSSGELGIQLASMLHFGAVVPNLTFSADAHYHHLTDDVIVGGQLQYRNGCIDVPTLPGLGVELDREKLKQYSKLYDVLGGYPYDRDPQRPQWFPLLPNPNSRYADASLSWNEHKNGALRNVSDMMRRTNDAFAAIAGGSSKRSKL